jgi:hypothetical protein
MASVTCHNRFAAARSRDAADDRTAFFFTKYFPLLRGKIGQHEVDVSVTRLLPDVIDRSDGSFTVAPDDYDRCPHLRQRPGGDLADDQL